ncbi:hypothetical protein CALVIDRAFT_192263 [Calocera viscosa TUFC12733]|uniref:Uncharacterized protein n=1 Tax=Calocera viscosa (strain TUFC12733) TaxID=1330018 RepID=A0A167KP88_CALVF|nr:hypothetical protein CALVIDRAFT_192263 [Calocera viscosa TUFC12733]
MADPTFACPCLNVRLYEQQSVDGNTETERAEEGWKRIFVGEEGIRITHVDMTMRTRSTVQPPPNEESYVKCSTVLTCLACRTPVYRTFQKLSWPLDSGVTEGPVVPSDDWIETEVLKSADGWIEVNTSVPGCVTGVSMDESKTSPRYSSTFSLLIPESTPTTPIDPYIPSLALEPVLPKIPALFPPPPQTPSHPMFQHLAMLASSTSHEARQKAEDELSVLVRQRVEELQLLDSRLRREVELLWSSWRESRQSYSASSRSENEIRRQRENEAQAASSSGVSRVTDFIPSAATRDTSSERSRAVSRDTSSVSLLSMSLRTGGLLYPPAQLENHTDEETDSVDQSIPTTPDEDSLEDAEHSIPMPHIRALTGSSHLEDVALSLRLTQMNAGPRGRAMSRSKLEPIEEKSSLQTGSARETNRPLRGRVGVEEIAAQRDRDRPASLEKVSEERASRDRDSTPNGRKSREDGQPSTPGTRARAEDTRPKHVTFEEDKQPTPPKTSKTRKAAEDEEPIFDFDADLPSQPARRKPRTPYETVVPSRKGKSTELSHASPQTSGVGVEADGTPSYFTLPRNPPRPPKLNTDTAGTPSKMPSTEAKLKELVGGYLPSHRSAWKDGRGWDLYSKVFQERSPFDGSEEDYTEDGVSSATSSQPQSVPGAATHSKPSIAASAPIDISPIARRARYSNLNIELQPKTSLVDRAGVMVPALRAAMRKDEESKEVTPTRRKRSASATRRNEAYARRDLHTHVDPGPIFEFSSSTEEDGAEFEGLSASEKVRRMATDMQGTSDGLPDAGMWRSMADS